MSLTSVLDNRRGELRRWFEGRLPNLEPMQRAWREAGQPTSACPVGVNPGVVGGAFDYRLRYHFGATPARRFVAQSGGRTHPDWPAFAAALDDTVERLQPVGRSLSAAEEAELNSNCWVLAIFESHFRMGSSRRYVTPIDALGPAPGVQALLELAPTAGLGDLADLMTKLRDSPLAGMVGRPTHLNPKLQGSALVGGADADLVLDGVLIEVKTTSRTAMTREAGYQLLGYLLLDFDDRLDVRSLGFYLSRIPRLLAWPIDDLLEQVAGAPVDLERLRDEFRAVCIRARAA